MAIEINRPDTFQTRFFQSFVNLTKYNSTTYPAITTVRITPMPNECTTCEPLTSYSVYDQWALRVVTNAAPMGAITP
jgi:hypothetical protein